MGITVKKCYTKDGLLIEGLFEVTPDIHKDSRGYFFESYSERDFFAAGLTMKFVQDNQSASEKGVLRGLHFQTRHPQGKLIRAVSGKMLDVAVDLRKDSPTFGKYASIILDSEIQNQLYIPKGFAHGFLVLSETAVSSYKCTDFYDPDGEAGIIWNDPTLNIDWQLEKIGGKPVLSEKDMRHPGFETGRNYFNFS